MSVFPTLQYSFFTTDVKNIDINDYDRQETDLSIICNYALRVTSLLVYFAAMITVVQYITT